MENTQIGTVYFFTGLSGAGKTTIGGLFFQRLKATKPNAVLMDGDAIRPVFCEDSGYTTADRLRRAERIFRVCKFLADQGIDVVCCSIAMFADVRDWNRQNIVNYREIYIKTAPATLLKRNQKGLYTSGKNVVGVDLPFEEPTYPDIVVRNDGDRTPLAIVEQLEAFFAPKADLAQAQELFHDRDYWNDFYGKKMALQEPSPFAQTAIKQMEKGGRIVDLGCGNGRDSLYFAAEGIDVVAIDIADVAIEGLQKVAPTNARFVCDDFVLNDNYQPGAFQYAYSRFTIHSITFEQERLLLQNIYMALAEGGKFFIEVRGVHDNLFGKGDLIGRNTYYYNLHYRRFIVLDELAQSLREVGFTIISAEEKTGFAPYGDEDPEVIRIVAQKQ